MPMSGPLERHHEATAAAEAQYGVISHQQLVTLLHMSEGRSDLSSTLPGGSGSFEVSMP